MDDFRAAPSLVPNNNQRTLKQENLLEDFETVDPNKPIKFMESLVSHIQKYTPINYEINIAGTSIDLTIDEKTLFIGSSEGEIALIDITSRSTPHKAKISQSGIIKIRLSKNNDFLYVLCQDGNISKFDAKKLTNIFNIPQNEIVDFVLNFDDRIFYTLEANGCVKMWTTYFNYDFKVLLNENIPGHSIAIDSNNCLLAVGCSHGIVIIISIKDREIFRKISLDYFEDIKCISFFPNRQRVLFGSEKGRLYVYDFYAEKNVGCVKAHNGKVNACVVSVDGELFVTGGEDKQVCIWDANNFSEGVVLTGHDSQVKDLIIPYKYSYGSGLEDQNTFGGGRNRVFPKNFNSRDIYSISCEKIIFSKVPSFDTSSEAFFDTPILQNCQIFSTTSSESNFLFFQNNRIFIPSSTSNIERITLDQFHYFNLQNICCSSFNQSKIRICIANLQEKNSEFDEHMFIITLFNLKKRLETKLTITSKGIKSLYLTKKKKYIFIGEINQCRVYDERNKLWSFLKTSHNEIVSLEYSEKRNILFAISQNRGFYYSVIPIIPKNIQFKNLREIDVFKTVYIDKNDLLIIVYKDYVMEVWETRKIIKINSIKVDLLKDILKGPERFLICIVGDLIVSYCVPECVKHFTIKMYEKPMSFCLMGTEKKIAVLFSDRVVFYKNPLKCEEGPINLIGDYRNSYNIYDYLSKVIYGTINNQYICFSSWVFEPYHINEVHLYAYLNDFGRLKKALENGIGMFPSRHGISPLDICLEMNYEESFKVIYLYMKAIRKTNPLFLSILESSLIKLIDSQIKSSYKIFRFFFCKSLDTTLPKYYKVELSMWKRKKLPFSFETNKLFPEKNNIKFVKKDLTTGNKLKFKQTYFRICMIPGSEKSIHLLTRVIHNEKNIFNHKLEFISFLLDHKWKTARVVAWTMIILFGLYFILINYYIFNKDMNALILACFVNAMLMINVLIQLMSLKLRFFMLGWGLQDTIVITSTFVLFFYKYFDIPVTDVLDILVLYLAWQKGYSYFRVFRATGFYINLIKWVFVDIAGFVSIFIYSMVGIAAVAKAVYKFETFTDSLKFAWELNIGGFDTTNYTIFMYLLFFAATFFGPIILLNLLITIMTNTFQKVKNQIRSSECKEIAQLLREAENVYYLFNKDKDNKQYLHRVTSNIKVSSRAKTDGDAFLERLRELKMKMKKFERRTGNNFKAIMNHLGIQEVK